MLIFLTFYESRKDLLLNKNLHTLLFKRTLYIFYVDMQNADMTSLLGIDRLKISLHKGWSTLQMQ